MTQFKIGDKVLADTTPRRKKKKIYKEAIVAYTPTHNQDWIEVKFVNPKGWDSWRMISRDGVIKEEDVSIDECI